MRVAEILTDLDRLEPKTIVRMSLGREGYPIILGNIDREAFCRNRSSRLSFQRRKLLRSRGKRNQNSKVRFH